MLGQAQQRRQIHKEWAERKTEVWKSVAEGCIKHLGTSTRNRKARVGKGGGVEVLEVDRKGKIRLSMKSVDVEVATQ